jgi:hypothetical protein
MAGLSKEMINGERAVVRVCFGEETKVRGPLCKHQRHRGIVLGTLYWMFKRLRSSVQSSWRTRERVSSVGGLAWAGLSSLLFIILLFIFLPGLGNL